MTDAQPPLDLSDEIRSQQKIESREKLPAEKTFDKAVYGGISYFAQAFTGIALTWWLTFDKGRPYFNKMAEWAGPKIWKNKSVEKAAEEVSAGLITTIMVTVGNTFILPVKWLENKKPEIVRSLHEKRVKHEESNGHAYSSEQKAHHEKCLQDLANQPKQTWMSLLSGRAFGLGAVYAVLGMLGNTRNEAIRQSAAQNIVKGVDKIGLKKLAQSKTFSQFMELGFVDMFYSAIAAGGLYVYSHTIKPPVQAEESTVDPSSKVETIKSETVIPEAMNSPRESFQSVIKQSKMKDKPEKLYTKKIASEDKTSSLSLSL